MSTKPGRFSILRLMAVVSLVAIDCALLRAWWDDSGTSLFLLLTLPTLNLMILNASKLRRGQSARPFWVGFDVVGLACVALLWMLRPYNEETVWLYPVWWLAANLGLSEDSAKDTAILCVVVSAIGTAPQWLIAGLAGWWSSRYRVVIKWGPRLAEPVAQPEVFEF